MKVKHSEKLGYKVHTVGPKQSIQFERITKRNVTKTDVKSLLKNKFFDKNKWSPQKLIIIFVFFLDNENRHLNDHILSIHENVQNMKNFQCDKCEYKTAH